MTFDQRLALMTGVDIPIPECQLTIHQPTINEISIIGELEYNLGVQLICIDKDHLLSENAEAIDMNNFNLLMTILNEDKEKAADKKQSVKNILSLVLPSYQIILTPRSILCKKGEENLIIDEENFDFLQQILRKVFCVKYKNKEGEVPDRYNPANEKARQIAEKIYRGRKQLEEIRKNNNPDDSLFSRYVSILAIGLNSMTIEDLKKLTVFQITDLFERFTLKIAQDMDASVRLAGGKPEKDPENWMKPLH